MDRTATDAAVAKSNMALNQQQVTQLRNQLLGLNDQNDPQGQ